MKVLTLRTAYWLLAEIGNALGYVGVGGIKLHAWAQQKYAEVGANV